MENIISQGQAVTIDGKEYLIRRLNTRDVFKVAQIIGKVYKPGMTYTEGSETAFASSMVAALPVAEEDIFKLLAGLLNVTVEEFENFPPEALFDVIEALAKSEDLKRFFDKVKGILAKLGNSAPNVTA